MTTITVETQVEKDEEDDVVKFYLESLGSLQLRELDREVDDFSQFYYYVRDLVTPHTRYTALDKLGPIVLYMFLKTRGVLLVLPDFLDLYKLKYYEFTTDLKTVIKFYPEFYARDKKSIIKKYITTILQNFQVEEQFNSHALTLFDHFYPLVEYRKEEIVAVVICALTAISFDLNQMSMRLICSKAGIRQSSLNRAIVDKIFPYLEIPSTLKFKPSFELVKSKIRKKTSLPEIKVWAVEDEIEYLWRSCVSMKQIAEVVEMRKEQVVEILKRNLGDFRNYIVRFQITQQEIDLACRLRKEGSSYREIISRIQRPLRLAKKIVQDNLTDYAKYKYTPQQDRIKLSRVASSKASDDSKIYLSREPIIQLYYELLRNIKSERSQKIPLSKLSYLLLNHQDHLRKNISKLCNYLSKNNIYRTEKTVLALVLALSFPHIPQLHVSNLIGLSPSAIRSNLKIEKLNNEFVSSHLNLVIKEQINVESIFDYLDIIGTAIRMNTLPHVEFKELTRVIKNFHKIKANVFNITSTLREKGLYRDEILVLATAIYISCPSLNKKVTEQIILDTLKRKIKFAEIKRLQNDVVVQGSCDQDQFSLMEQLGELLEERETDVLCTKCGNFVYLQIYQNNKKIFKCNRCVFQ